MLLRYLADILKADLDPAVLDDPSNLRIDYVGLCGMIVELFQWQIEQPPDINPTKHRGLINAWIAVLRGVTAILLALQPAITMDIDLVRPLVPKIKNLEIPVDMKSASDELLLALQTICLGSAPASRAIAHWEGMMFASRRSLKSGHGSEYGDLITRDGDDSPTINDTTSDVQIPRNDTPSSLL